ncbi:Lcl C-terminal domain-containing protein [Geotalea uraniireducens]|uniref:Lcl C-terminal domain-containing protein n=1 Tax=Geotalea uraniireducens (strain Rf4) TaxID=351605 RepID=A5GBU8_GEOUR|nr:DUF1566 domain-containing protein [Geotalea uraniireducens]ABQ24951.1 protein of unknown function DUF1566 [Geotalea uraniireducens Rf4]
MNKLITALSLVCLTIAAVAFAVTTGTIQLPKTGQTTSYAAGDDGALQKGAVAPSPRFADNADGTVTDNLTGLVWLKNANCTDTVGGINRADGYLTWADALTWSNNLASGACGLSDGSTAGQWRLPNSTELDSLVDIEHRGPALPAGHPFTGAQLGIYWSSSSSAGDNTYGWGIDMNTGDIDHGYPKSIGLYVWPVRAVQGNIKPDAATVKAAYDTVNDNVNYLCSADVNNDIATATAQDLSYAGGTLSVHVTPTAGTSFPVTVVYTMDNFVAGPYIVSGSQTALITSPSGWTATGSLTGTGSVISSLLSNMVNTSGTTTGTLTVNGYPYDYATGAYK